MHVTQLHSSSFSKAYGILCSLIPQYEDREGLYASFCQIAPGEHTIAHAHFEQELFYIICGTGMMVIEQGMQFVSAGDVIRIPPFARHELKNQGADDLVFLSVYSEDSAVSRLPVSIVITSAPPTPNGPLHLGHISGPYLASDLLARYLRLRSVDVLTHCGTDDHQNYVDEKAYSLGVLSDQYRQQMRSRIQKGLDTMNIQFDEFIEPKQDGAYQDRIVNFFQRAIASGVIQKESIQLPYCTHCDITLVDAFISGYCPYCHEKSHGACEACGMVVMPTELQDARCSRCNQSADQKRVSVYTFSLSQYLVGIQEDLAQLSLSSRLDKLVKRVLQTNNMKMLLTYPGNNHQGISVPDSDHIIHVWFEMAAHYEQFALSDAFWSHHFGFDNGFYYLLFIPSLLRAMNQQAKLPNKVVTNDFLQLDGLKFSTSRKHAIWADEFSGQIDHLRLYLLLNRPVSSVAHFSMARFQAWSELIASQLQHVFQRAAILAKQQKSGVTPSILIDCNRHMREMEYCLSPTNVDLRRASRQLLSFIDMTLESEGTGSSERLMLHALAVLMAPFMPEASKHLFSVLEESDQIWVKDWSVIYAVI